MPRALIHLGPRRALQVIRELLRGISRPVHSVATSRYFSALPIKFGACAVKYALTPHTAAAPGARPGKAPEHLAEELVARLATAPVVYDFQVQFYVDDARTPIESSSQEWLEQDAPWLTVARLTLPQQDPASPHGRRVAALIETLSFDPWHATEELRPLGSMMRARNAAYRLSTQQRGAAGEPDGTELAG